MFFKKLVEMTFVRKAKFTGNFIDPHIAKPKPMFYKPESVVSNILLDGFAALMFKIATQVSSSDAKLYSHLRGL